MATRDPRLAAQRPSYYSSPSAQRSARQQRFLLLCGLFLYAGLPVSYVLGSWLRSHSVTKDLQVTKLLPPNYLPPPVQARSKSEETKKTITEPTPDEAEKPIPKDPPPEKLPPVDVSEVHIPGSTPLRITDPENCLSQVLAAFGGYVGFAPADDHQYVTKKFQPSGVDWEPVQLNNKESIQKYEPAVEIERPYGFIDMLRRKYGLSEREYVAYALFPLEFEDRMISAVRIKAAESGIKGDIGYADLVLDPQQGVTVLPNTIRAVSSGVSH